MYLKSKCMFHLFCSCNFSCSLSLLWSIHIFFYLVPYSFYLNNFLNTYYITKLFWWTLLCILVLYSIWNIYMSHSFLKTCFSCGLETLVVILPLNILKMLPYSLFSLFLIWNLPLYLSFSSLSFVYSIYFSS